MIHADNIAAMQIAVGLYMPYRRQGEPLGAGLGSGSPPGYPLRPLVSKN